MTTARKPRSGAAARKTTADAGTVKKATASKARAKPGKASAALTAHTQDTVRAPVPAEGRAPDAPVPSHAAAPLQGGAAPTRSTPDAPTLHRMIAEAAYYRAERRGFAPGGEEMDWLAAEAELKGQARRT